MFKGFYNLTSGMLSQGRRLDVIANNMTNVATSGYKTDTYTDSTFQEYMVSRVGNKDKSAPAELGGASYILAPSKLYTDYTQGALEPTDLPFDFALEGEGFFAIQTEGGIAYTRICCLLTVGVFVQVLCERLLQATGRATQTMIIQLTGAVINIILDPVFIHGWLGVPKMGIAGAAVATVIGQCTGACLGIYLNLRRNPDIRLSLRYLRPNGKVIGPILSVGVPTIVMNGIGSVMNFGINQILQGFHEIATGVFGIYFKLQSFFFMPLFGINNATISIIAYNYGARKPKRIVGTLRLATTLAVCIMVAGLLIFQLFPQVLLGFFNPSEEFLRIGTKALRILCLPFPAAAVCIALSAAFQALGNGIYSTITSLCRQLLVLLPAAYLLSLTGDVGNVWWAFPIAEVASVLVTLLLFARIYRQKVKPLFPAAE